MAPGSSSPNMSDLAIKGGTKSVKQSLFNCQPDVWIKNRYVNNDSTITLFVLLFFFFFLSFFAFKLLLLSAVLSIHRAEMFSQFIQVKGAMTFFFYNYIRFQNIQFNLEIFSTHKYTEIFSIPSETSFMFKSASARVTLFLSSFAGFSLNYHFATLSFELAFAAHSFQLPLCYFQFLLTFATFSYCSASFNFYLSFCYFCLLARLFIILDYRQCSALLIFTQAFASFSFQLAILYFSESE